MSTFQEWWKEQNHKHGSSPAYQEARAAWNAALEAAEKMVEDTALPTSGEFKDLGDLLRTRDTETAAAIRTLRAEG